MRQALHDTQAAILTSRVYIANTTRLLEVNELARQWGIAKITLYRYVYPEYRELSRRSARLQSATKRHHTDECQICGKSLHTHARCPVCEILNHGRQCIH